MWDSLKDNTGLPVAPLRHLCPLVLRQCDWGISESIIPSSGITLSTLLSLVLQNAEITGDSPWSLNLCTTVLGLYQNNVMIIFFSNIFLTLKKTLGIIFLYIQGHVYPWIYLLVYALDITDLKEGLNK